MTPHGAENRVGHVRIRRGGEGADQFQRRSSRRRLSGGHRARGSADAMMPSRSASITRSRARSTTLPNCSSCSNSATPLRTATA